MDKGRPAARQTSYSVAPGLAARPPYWLKFDLHSRSEPASMLVNPESRPSQTAP